MQQKEEGDGRFRMLTSADDGRRRERFPVIVLGTARIDSRISLVRSKNIERDHAEIVAGIKPRTCVHWQIGTVVHHSCWFPLVLQPTSLIFYSFIFVTDDNSPASICFPFKNHSTVSAGSVLGST